MTSPAIPASEPAGSSLAEFDALENGQKPLRPHRWFTAALAVLLALLVAARFVFLQMDAPYTIISSSGAFLTDEGYYTKSALLFVRFGEWTSDWDIVWRSHNWLFTVTQAGWMKLLGTSVAVARSLSSVAFVLSIAAFYSICRTVQTQTISLVSCLLAALTLQTFAYSRMALIEPFGTAFCIGAMWAWVRHGRTAWGPFLSMLLVACAVWSKVSFVYALVAVVLLNLGEGVVAWRRGERRQCVVTMVSVAIVLVTMRFAHAAAMDWAARDGVIFQQWHVTARADGLNLATTVKNEAKMLFKLCWETGASSLTCALGFGVLCLMIKGRLRARMRLGISRATVAMVLWCVGGASFFGLFEYQPPRYYFFVMFPIAYCTVMSAREIVGNRNWRMACLFLLFLHGATQVHGYKRWLMRDELFSYRNTARQVLQKMEFEESGPTILMGGTSAYVSYFDERVRPIGYMRHDNLAARLKRWRPRYLLARESAVAELQPTCPSLVARVVEIDRYPLLGNYYYGGDHILAEITYLD